MPGRVYQASRDPERLLIEERAEALSAAGYPTPDDDSAMYAEQRLQEAKAAACLTPLNTPARKPLGTDFGRKSAAGRYQRQDLSPIAFFLTHILTTRTATHCKKLDILLAALKQWWLPFSEVLQCIKVTDQLFRVGQPLHHGVPRNTLQSQC